jgi:hypothetical protein
MGNVLVSVPDFAPTELCFDDEETRQILKFFWPDSSAAIDALPASEDARRLAQTAFVAAIDGSYAMGYIEALLTTIAKRNPDIRTLAKRLGRKFVRHWWQNAKAKDLEDVRIYESVRVSIARSLRARFENLANGIVLERGVLMIYAEYTPAHGVWR